MRSLARMVLATAMVAQLLGATESRANQHGCAIIGPAIDFGAVATKWLRARTGTNKKFYYVPAPFFGRATCAPVMKLGRLGRWGDDVVATEDEKIAISFASLPAPPMCHTYGSYLYPCAGPAYCYDFSPQEGYPCNAHRLFGDLVTGGGSIRSSNHGQLLPATPYGVLDTTGSHPGVATCEAAMAHVPLAGAALAQGLLPGEAPGAERPIIDLGDVRVDRDDIATLSETPGADVTFYRARDVVLESGRVYRSGGESYQAEGATLNLSGAIVLNVTGKLRLGRATSILATDDAAINLVGRGAGVNLAKRAIVESALVAPERRVSVRANGGGYEFPYGTTGPILAERIAVTGAGFIDLYDYFDPVCP